MTKEIQFLFIGLIIAAIALIYNLYGLWNMPEKHVKSLVDSVEDWWPFADFYRRWFASKAYLWLFRIGSALFLLIVMTILSLLVLGVMGLLP